MVVRISDSDARRKNGGFLSIDSQSQEWQAQEGPNELAPRAQSVKEPESFLAWRRPGGRIRCVVWVSSHCFGISQDQGIFHYILVYSLYG